MSSSPPNNNKRKEKPAEAAAPLAYTETRSRKKARETLDLISGTKQRQESLFNLLGKEYTGPSENQLQMIFRLFDTNRDGKIGPDELAGVLRSMGKRPLTKRIDKILEACDQDKKGYIVMDEFVEYMQNKALEKAKLLGLIQDTKESSDVEGGDTDEEKEDGTPKKRVTSPKAKKAATKKTAAATTAATTTTTTTTTAPPKALAKQPSFFAPLKKGSSIVHFYTENAGVHETSNAPRDKFNNPLGKEYDLGIEGAFTSFTILIGRFYNLELKCEADLKSKGFNLIIVSTQKQFIDALPKADIGIIISGINGDSTTTQDAFVVEVRKFHQSGKGLFLWADNEPYLTQCNWVLSDLFGESCSVKGNETGTKDLTLGLGTETQKFASHLITSGIVNLYEGITISSMSKVPNTLSVLGTSSAGNAIMFHSNDSALPQNCGRVVIDTGFTKLMNNYYSAGVERYIKNACVWLLSLDHRFGMGVAVQGGIETPKEQPVWQYQHGDWYNYDTDASKVAEDAYQDWLGNPSIDVRAVKSGHWAYQLDFRLMLQTNIQHQSHTQRPIRRHLAQVVTAQA
eukprot:gene15496-18405_t